MLNVREGASDAQEEAFTLYISRKALDAELEYACIVSAVIFHGGKDKLAVMDGLVYHGGR